ncbi:MAG: hypothetical protein N4A57_08915 [Anaeromicrobium sp.]|jgi:hypothetical protein|uniref:hypothetical protein n=1 Tax=Anaeromicrobium sp. TaxID=1929132 RepID=UPI0025E5947D|nr:hypothetical protein [Anaeromicrobium sp.]MCT4594372.1 hypothetical protein [Anaeromicrobium sp.]
MVKYILSFVLGIVIVGLMESFGIVERYFIIFFTINLFLLVKNMGKIKMKKLICMIVCISCGFIITSYCSFRLAYDSGGETIRATFKYKEKTAVLLVFEGEPKKYNLPILLKNIKGDKRFKPILTTPFKLYKRKRIYERMGNSNYEQICNNIYLKLVNRLGKGYDVFLGYSKNTPYYEELINKKIFKNNYKRIIVVPIALTESKVYYNTINNISMKEAYYKDCEFKFAKPLYSSKNVVLSIIRSINNRQEGLDKNKIGIILLGEASKNLENKYVEHRSIKEEGALVKKIKKGLVNLGYDERKILYGFDYPNGQHMEKLLIQLQQYGIEKIFIVNTGDIVDTINNQYIVHKIINHANNMEEIESLYIKGWGEDDLLIEAIEFKIRSINVEKWN